MPITRRELLAALPASLAATPAAIAPPPAEADLVTDAVRPARAQHRHASLHALPVAPRASRCHQCSFGALPFPHSAILTAVGVYSDTLIPALLRARRATRT